MLKNYSMVYWILSIVQIRKYKRREKASFEASLFKLTQVF